MNEDKASYRWIITRDRYTEWSNENHTNLPPMRNETGREGPRNLDTSIKPTQRFRMKVEDDGEDEPTVIYEGLIGGEYEGFEPLDDFGTPNFGCVEIEYLNDGKWELL